MLDLSNIPKINIRFAKIRYFTLKLKIILEFFKSIMRTKNMFQYSNTELVISLHCFIDTVQYLSLLIKHVNTMY